MPTHVRTYMVYPDKIDPARILTMPDLVLSVALSSTLVTFDDARGMVAGLAEKWSQVEPNKLKFVLRKNLRWSDGTDVTAGQYRDALLRAKRLYGSDLKALFEAVHAIDAPDSHTLIFTTRNDITSSGILLKLTEPMYGLVALKSGDEVDLGKSAGAFLVKSASKDLLVLSLNKNWYDRKPGMPDAIEIKHPPKDVGTLSTFEKDSWANLVSGSSVLQQKTADSFKDNNYRVWQRSFDRLFALYPSKTFLQRGGTKVMQSLARLMNADEILQGLAGYAKANQFFPRGYTLWSSSGPREAKVEKRKFAETIKVIVPDTWNTIQIADRLESVIKGLGGAFTAVVETFPLSTLNDRLKNQDYDILATGIAVADPNFEGAISFFIERDPPFIPSSVAPSDFSDQVKVARSLGTTAARTERMKEIMLRAQEAGHVLPLFHYSSLSVAKPGLDLSGVPSTDETIHFSKVRILQ